jgi:hypothetical protein
MPAGHSCIGLESYRDWLYLVLQSPSSEWKLAVLDLFNQARLATPFNFRFALCAWSLTSALSILCRILLRSRRSSCPLARRPLALLGSALPMIGCGYLAAPPSGDTTSASLR